MEAVRIRQDCASALGRAFTLLLFPKSAPLLMSDRAHALATAPFAGLGASDPKHIGGHALSGFTLNRRWNYPDAYLLGLSIAC